MNRFGRLAALAGTLGGLLWLFVPEFAFTHNPQVVPDAVLPACLLAVPLLALTAESVRRCLPEAAVWQTVAWLSASLVAVGIGLVVASRTGRGGMGVVVFGGLLGAVALLSLWALSATFAYGLVRSPRFSTALGFVLAFAVPLDAVVVVYSERLLGFNVSVYGLVWALLGVYVWLAGRVEAEQSAADGTTG